METNIVGETEQLKKLKGKAEVTRNAHAHVGRKCEKASNVINIFVICGSVMSTAVIFADYTIFNNILKDITGLIINSYYFIVIIGIINILIFSLSLIGLLFKYDKRAESHYQAVKLLTTLIKDIDRTKDGHIINDNEVRTFTERYNWINESSPLIPDQDFLESKRRYKLKRSISTALDDEKNVGKTIKVLEKEIVKK